MTAEIVGIEKRARGDVYLAMGASKTHPLTVARNAEGIVFLAVRRRVTFEEYSSGVPHFQRLNDATLESGYYSIVADPPEGSDPPEPGGEVVEGIFVFHRTNKGNVAAAVRRHFGEGSVLLKEGRCPECGGGMDYDHEGNQRCKNCNKKSE